MFKQDFLLQNRDPEQSTRTIIMRDGTIYQDVIEIRRVFLHPNFQFPSLYNDIAIGELGLNLLYYIF